MKKFSYMVLNPAAMLILGLLSGFAAKEVETDEELLDKLLDMSEKQENSSAEKASAGIGGENRNIYITGSHQNDHAGEVNDGAKQIEGVYG